MRKFINGMFYLLIAVCVIFFIMLAFGFRFRIVLSGSMKDIFPVGSIIVNKKFPFQDLKVGDDITFIQDEKVITHRIIEINYEEKSILTQGTNNEDPDERISEEQILDKVYFHIPYAGIPIFYLKKYFILILLSIASIALLIYGIKSLRECKK